VTGARGFIGRHLLGHLVDVGADVHAVARPGRAPADARRGGSPGLQHISWHEADLTDPDQIEGAIRSSDPEVVFHLASTVTGRRSVDVVGAMLENNTRAAVNVMTAAHRLENRRVVLAGSVEEPRAEEAPCSPYAAAKGAATACARLFHRQWDLPVTVLRPAMVYGPSQPDETKLLPYVIGSMLDGRRPRLSSGARPIDWVYIDDVCRAFLLAAVHPAAPGLVADIGSGTATTIAETVQMVAALTGYSGLIGLGDLRDRAIDVAHIADNTSARDVLGWRPRTSFARGLTETVHWHRTRRDAELETMTPDDDIRDLSSSS
jgi:nucleoside-diphosphate-sugar epimerase